jgi:hypothetical protein
VSAGFYVVDAAAMPFQRNADPFTPRRRPQDAPETDFRHAGLVSTEPCRMDAAFMRLGRHERGIHVV